MDGVRGSRMLQNVWPMMHDMCHPEALAQDQCSAKIPSSALAAPHVLTWVGFTPNIVSGENSFPSSKPWDFWIATKNGSMPLNDASAYLTIHARFCAESI